MNYVTIESVTTQLGPNWQGDGDANLAVTQANAWLRAKPLQKFEKIPDDILLAGAQLASLASKNQLYKEQKEGVVASKTISAQSGTSVSKTYAVGKEEGKSSAILFIEDLIKPYLYKKGVQWMMRV